MSVQNKARFVGSSVYVMATGVDGYVSTVYT